MNYDPKNLGDLGGWYPTRGAEVSQLECYNFYHSFTEHHSLYRERVQSFPKLESFTMAY